MRPWDSEAKSISELDPRWRARARQRLKSQTRPVGSLGVLEHLLERLVAIQRMEKPDVTRKEILIFAADHGVSHEGVSFYPRDVTRAMVLNFLNGGATINALGRKLNAQVKVVDVGVDADFEGEKRLVHAKIRKGSRNILLEPAMTEQELDAALTVGWDAVHQAKSEGIQLLGLGEMGIGNTTIASAMVSAILECPPEEVTGRGTGVDDGGLLKKVTVIQQALEKHRPQLQGPMSILQYLGGYEFAALTGAILASAKLGIPVVIDGWNVSAAALVALGMNPHIIDYLFFAHQSEERGHRYLFQTLEVEPLLNFSMRLGEASGAALAMDILDAAVKIFNEVATFEEAGVSTSSV